MSISLKVKEGIAASAWVVKIFEGRSQTGSGDKEMYDFRLGNPKIEPPLKFVEELKKVANNPFPEMHGYSALAGHIQTREAIATMLSKERGLPFTAQHVIMTAGGAGALNIILKAIIINSPNNPTGTIYSEESLKSVARLLNEKNRQFGKDIFLIYDAAYQDIVYDGIKIPDIFSIYSNTIFAASYSKPLSIPGV